MYLHIDSNREQSPFVTDRAGRTLDRNPLKDVRVRRAMSKAIYRQALVERVMEGAARATGQLMPAGMFGYTAAIKPEPYDPDGARKLLAEAGYADGFALTIHGPNDRYVNDEQVAQAIAQMLSRIGIATRVETMPSSVYFTRANKLEFSMMLVGWGSDTAEASSPLKALLATFNNDKGMGQANRGRYSNPKMDAVLQQALATVDDGRREKLLQQATEIAMSDLGIIPLYHQENVWATRKASPTPRAPTSARSPTNSARSSPDSRHTREKSVGEMPALLPDASSNYAAGAFRRAASKARPAKPSKARLPGSGTTRAAMPISCTLSTAPTRVVPA